MSEEAYSMADLPASDRRLLLSVVAGAVLGVISVTAAASWRDAAAAEARTRRETEIRARAERWSAWDAAVAQRDASIELSWWILQQTPRDARDWREFLRARREADARLAAAAESLGIR